MANTFKVLYRGAASTGETTLYTAPISTTTIINSILVANSSASAMTYNLKLDAIPMATTVSVPANDTIVLDIKQVLAAGDTISGLASASTVYFHISGLEVT